MQNEPSNPGLFRYWRAFRHAKGKGLTDETARAYATLVWWGLWYGFPVASIQSGRRTEADYRRLLAAWERGDPGVAVRPARNSKHFTGEAFDLERTAHNWAYGQLAQAAGLRWGGNFKTRDELHFDAG